MEIGDRRELIDGLSDDDLLNIASMITPWSTGPRINDTKVADEDGFTLSGIGVNGDYTGYAAAQNACWEKFSTNPQISSHVRDFMGDLTGAGFSWGSENNAVDAVLKEISDDLRNELLLKISKYVARSEVEGELFLCLSLHKDSFVEVDFMEPTDLIGGVNNSGIYFHPRKKTMPMFYEFAIKTEIPKKKNKTKKNAGGKIVGGVTSDIASTILIPSIYVGYYPDLGREAIAYYSLSTEKLKGSKSNIGYSKTGNWHRFIVSWDRGFLTQRNVSHINTTLSWVNFYEDLKKWEIDHKKSAGSYLWVVKMEDARTFRSWLKMTDEEKEQTGLTAKKTPGGTLICPPGVEIECKNPKLPTISEQDTDIMHMISSGLNRPEDMITGQTKGDTFSGVKASRGPQSDRVLDNMHYFEQFLRLVLWRSIFFLKSTKSTFKIKYKVKEVVQFKNQKPIEQTVVKEAHELIDFDFPTPEIGDLEGKAKAYLGSKHLSVVESLGIPRAEVAKRLGFRNYGKKRKLFETENKIFPDLPLTGELESAQEGAGESRHVHPGTPQAPSQAK